MATMVEPLEILELARRELGLSVDDLWMRYFALGGMSSALEIEAYLLGALVTPSNVHDRIAVALNERFAELDRDHPVPYSADGSEDA
jgi:hypothetical protein